MSTPGPVLSLENVSLTDGTRDGTYGSRYASLGELLGMKHIGISFDIIAPGHRICPFHNHLANDEFYVVLEGEGSYRTPLGLHPVKAGDVIAAPAGGRDTAHQLMNSSDAVLKVLVFSSMREPDICEYPDSDKFAAFAGPQGARTFSHVGRRVDAVPYYEGE